MVDQRFVAGRPEDVGIDSERLEAVFARAQRDVDDGTLPSAQVAVARHGRLAGMRTFGAAVQGGERRPATDETLYCIFSCTKAVVAAAVWQLLEEGKLRLDERVAEIIPEFATNGKDAVTVEQVLLHTAGFPYAPYHPDGWRDHDKRLEAFSRWRLTWEPDSRWEYHATAAHWVLVEILERRTGVEFRQYIRDRVTGPLGLDDLYVGLPDEQRGRVAVVEWVGDRDKPPPGGWGEVTPEAIERFAEPSRWDVGLPGGGGIAGAGELALFYQALINGGANHDGTRILKPETIAFATEVRTDPSRHKDATGTPVLRGLSIVIAGDDGQSHMRGLGRTVSPRAFGHDGAGGQIAWGDPETGISLGYCTNGFLDWLSVGRRVTAVSSLAAVCAAEAEVPARR